MSELGIIVAVLLYPLVYFYGRHLAWSAACREWKAEVVAVLGDLHATERELDDRTDELARCQKEANELILTTLDAFVAEQQAHRRTAAWLYESGHIPEELGGTPRRFGRTIEHYDASGTRLGESYLSGPGIDEFGLQLFGNIEQALDAKEIAERAYDAGWHARQYEYERKGK